MYARGDQAEKIFTNHRLDELVILNFSSSDISTFVHEFPTILSKECLAKTRVVTLKDFFTQYFTLEEYEYYLKNVKETLGPDHIGHAIAGDLFERGALEPALGHLLHVQYKAATFRMSIIRL